MGDRWEWRVFGDRFGRADELLRGEAPSMERRSEETYILAPPDTVNAKIRGGKLDVKKLLRRSGDGLELWTVVLKIPFPVGGDDLAPLFELWGAPPLADRASRLGPEAFVRRIGETPPLTAVRVSKIRRMATLDGCSAELADLEIEGKRTRSLAVESEDAGAVLAAVRRLGRDPGENTSFVAALKEIVGYCAAPRD